MPRTNLSDTIELWIKLVSCGRDDMGYARSVAWLFWWHLNGGYTGSLCNRYDATPWEKYRFDKYMENIANG